MLLAFVPLALSVQAPAPADVLISHNTPGRTGVNAAETALTPARVTATTFGKLWTLYADGQVVAQPLYLSNLAVETSANPATPRVQGTFNAVLIATMHNTVYLYDADHERPGPDGRTVCAALQAQGIKPELYCAPLADDAPMNYVGRIV